MQGTAMFERIFGGMMNELQSRNPMVNAALQVLQDTSAKVSVSLKAACQPRARWGRAPPARNQGTQDADIRVEMIQTIPTPRAPDLGTASWTAPRPASEVASCRHDLVGRWGRRMRFN